MGAMSDRMFHLIANSRETPERESPMSNGFYVLVIAKQKRSWVARHDTCRVEERGPRARRRAAEVRAAATVAAQRVGGREAAALHGAAEHVREQQVARLVPHDALGAAGRKRRAHRLGGKGGSIAWAECASRVRSLTVGCLWLEMVLYSAP